MKTQQYTISRDMLKGAYSEGDALRIYNKVKATNDFAGFLHAFMHDDDYQVARNTLWGLTKATDAELAQLQPAMNELIDLAISTDNSSVRRLALTVAYRLEVTEDDLRADFLDFCLEHMADIGELPGIQSVCMKHAHRISSFYPELMGELMRTIEAMDMSYYKPAVKSVRRRILEGKLKHTQSKRNTPKGDKRKGTQGKHVSLRKFRDEDAETILSWCKDRHSFRLWSADRYKDFPASPAEMLRQYEGDGKHPLTMTIDGKPCGHILLRFPSEDKTLVRFGFVIVDDKLRGKGYGKQLLQLALDYTHKELNAQRITLGVFLCNIAAIECYKSMGFKIIGTDSYPIDGEEWDGYEMEFV